MLPDTSSILAAWDCLMILKLMVCIFIDKFSIWREKKIKQSQNNNEKFPIRFGLCLSYKEAFLNICNAPRQVFKHF